MIVLIDNYDSFSYNLYQLVGQRNPEIRVVRNDELTVEEIEGLTPECLILSPGPGKPSDAGVCIDVVQRLGHKVPILGVCLGHQSIYEAYGGRVSYAQRLMHGKSSGILVNQEHLLFQGLPSSIQVGRYHSLAAVRDALPDELHVIAETKEGEIMAVSHITHPVFGLQFHPESILTPEGGKIIGNFLEICS